MSRRPAAKGKADANQSAITRSLRKAGVELFDLSSVGGGCPDLAAVHKRTGQIVLLEVKTAKGKLTEKQKALNPCWNAVIVRNESEALRAIGVSV